MSDVRIFKQFDGGARADKAPATGAELVERRDPSERLDERLTRLEHVPGDGVWAKRRALGEGNRLGLNRGGGGACSYVIQVRVPDPALQPVHVKRLEDEDVKATQEVQARSWAEEEQAEEEAAGETVSVKVNR